MRAGYVIDTLDPGPKDSSCDGATVLHKPRLLSDNGPSYIAGELAEYIEAIVKQYNHQHYQESLNNVTPADADFGRAAAVIEQLERIKQQTIEYQRLQYRKITG